MPPVVRSPSLFLTLWTLLALVQFNLVNAQDESTSSNSPTTSLSVTTTNITSTFTTTADGQTSTGVTVLQVTSTITPSPTSTENATSTETTSDPAESSDEPSLDTKIDPGFGVLGAILILTGLPSAFWGHKNRWSSFFIIGFYTFSLSCFALILKFGVLEAVSLPSAKLRGVFVLACSIAGIIGGAVAIFFWQQAKYFIGAWGGFALGLWIQCFRSGGLIRPIGLRWILYIGLGVTGFCLCTLPKLHYHVLLFSTAAVGASAFVLGIDCFTTANLKEFYVANLGFNSLYRRFEEEGIQFPVSQMMQIELGLIAAFTLMGAAVQLRILQVLQRKLKEIAMEQKKRDEDLENQAAARFALTAKELADWEKEHGRVDSHFSGLPLLKSQEAHSPNTEEGSTLVMEGQRRSRYQSGVSDFMAASGPEQASGALPAIDLGGDLEADLSKDFDTSRSNSISSSRALTPQEREDLKKKEELMAEITNIRKSIEQLRAATPGSSAEGGAHSRNPSFTSRRTLSLGLAEALDGPSRPPRSTDPRARINSMDRLSMPPDAFPVGNSISRPSSAPLQEDTAWNDYLRERKLFQPPSGISPPIAPSPVAPVPRHAPVPVPDSVADALTRRRQQEAAFEAGEFGAGRRIQHGRSSSHNLVMNDRPVSNMWNAQPKAATTNSRPPVTILPPKKPDASRQPSPPVAQRVHTFEELNERHREKMRNLQAPISQAEREHAALAEARNRWERSKEVEKQVMAKKQAEKEAAIKQRQDEKVKKQGDAQQRSLSADKLNKLAATTSPKRQSVLKVEDWRRYQQGVDTSSPRSKSPSKRDSTVPFPAAQNGREPGHYSSTNDRRRSQML